MYLIDTNIFLEILLNQEKSSDCKEFLNQNYDKIFISDFSLHSIGVILFRYKKKEIFKEFVQEILSEIKILNLPSQEYEVFMNTKRLPDLDFDDFTNIMLQSIII